MGTQGMDEGDVVAVLFADICDSTPLYETMGNHVAYEFNHACLESLKACTERNAGTVIRSVGDGLLATFPTAEAGFAAAVEMQSTRYDGDLTLKIAFHVGEVIHGFGGDVYGDAVNLTARLSSLAQAGEILLTDETVGRLPPNSRVLARHIDTKVVKGRRSPVGIYSVRNVLGLPTATQPVNVMSPVHGRGALLLEYEDRKVKLGANTPRLSIGRGEDCDLIVRSTYSSRHHADIESRSDRYLLTDRSANGTFLVNRAKDVLLLRRETVQLLGEGTIHLGGEPNLTDVDVIRYQCVTEANAAGN